MKAHHNVAVLGAAGGIGQPLSLLLKSSTLINRLVLFDITDTVQGLKVDLSHIETSVQVEAFIGSKDDDELQKAQLHASLQGIDVVIMLAGRPRGPNMSRDELFNINARIVKGTVEAIAEICPKAFICMISNPVNSTVPVAAEVLRKNGVFDSKRLFGINTLDVVRSNTFLAEVLQVNPKDLSVKVIGGHSGQTILPLLSGYNLGQEVIVELTEKIRNAGTEVVKAKVDKGSATFSMAYATARFCTSLLKALSGEQGIYECSYVYTDIVPGIQYFATRVKLGRNGVESIENIHNLSEYERGLLEAEVFPQLEVSIHKAIEFVANQ